MMRIYIIFYYFILKSNLKMLIFLYAGDNIQITY